MGQRGNEFALLRPLFYRFKLVLLLFVVLSAGRTFARADCDISTIPESIPTAKAATISMRRSFKSPIQRLRNLFPLGL